MGFHPYIWFSLKKILPKLLQIQVNCVRVRRREADECILHTSTSHIQGLSSAWVPKQGLDGDYPRTGIWASINPAKWSQRHVAALGGHLWIPGAEGPPEATLLQPNPLQQPPPTLLLDLLSPQYTPHMG